MSVLTFPKTSWWSSPGFPDLASPLWSFDIINKEGQRQYLDSLGLVTDQLTKPPVDSISGLSPSISIDQHLNNHSPRSTVGTVTEVFTYLRVLFARLGHRPCPNCGKDVPPPTFEFSEDEWMDENDETCGWRFSVSALRRFHP